MSEYYPNLNLPTFSEFGGGRLLSSSLLTS